MRHLTLCAAIVCLLVLAAAPAGARSDWQVTWRVVGSGSFLGGLRVFPVNGQTAPAPGMFVQPTWEVIVISSPAQLHAAGSNNIEEAQALSTAAGTDFRYRRLLLVEKYFSDFCCGLAIDRITTVGGSARVTVHPVRTACTPCSVPQGFRWVVQVLSVPRRLFAVPTHLAFSVGPLTTVSGLRSSPQGP